MVTDKECECISSAAKVINRASNLSRSWNKIKYDYIEDESRKGEYFEKLYQPIHEDSTMLKEEIERLEKTCAIPQINVTNVYIEGKKKLDESIKNKNIENAVRGADYIRDSILYMLQDKQLIDCSHPKT
jgi:hypothetical protein